MQLTWGWEGRGSVMPVMAESSPPSCYLEHAGFELGTQSRPRVGRGLPTQAVTLGRFVRRCGIAALLLHRSAPDRQERCFLMWCPHCSTILLWIALILWCQAFTGSGLNCQVCSRSHKMLQALNKRWIKVLVAPREWGWWKNEWNALEIWSSNTIVLCWFLFTLISSSEYKVPF